MQDMDQNIIKVLDHGYVKLINNMGSDLDIVNAARVSFEKEVSSLSDKDKSLMNFIIKNKHDSCLRHCVMTFEVYAPLMVARQAYKHNVASTMLDDQLGWNESSRRYVTENEEFYIPSKHAWRSAPENKKQGSSSVLPTSLGEKYSNALYGIVKQQHELYKQALADGVAPEQARLLLPAYGMYVRWRWTASLNALLHFLALRIDSTAQYEIQEYAMAIESFVQVHYPLTTLYWREHRVI